MAIRLKLDGLDIETDSAAEALEMYRQIAKMNGTRASKLSPYVQAPASAHEPATGVMLGNNAKKMIRLLLGRPDGELTTVVAAEIGVNGPKGLAAVTRQIRAWGKARFQLDDEQCVQGLLGKNGERLTSIAGPLASKVRGHEKELLG
jgi:hypothetical protein